MAWTTPRTWIVGEIVTAAQLNTHIRDNANASPNGISTASGDMTYAASPNQLTRIPVGAHGDLMTVSSVTGLPAWSSLIQSSGFELVRFRNTAGTSGSAVFIGGGDSGLGGDGTGWLGNYVEGSTSGIGGGTLHTRIKLTTDTTTIMSSNGGDRVIFTNAGALQLPLAVSSSVSLRLGGDVDLYRSVANVLNLASGDTLQLATDGSTGGLKLGAAGDIHLYRGAADTLHFASGDKLEMNDGTIKIVASDAAPFWIDGTGSVTMRIDAAAGATQARIAFEEAGTMAYRIGYNANDNRFFLESASGGADILRVPDSQLTVDGNATFDDNVFDFVCQSCGKHSERRFTCPCGGTVEWQDDVELMTRAVLPWRGNPAIAQMERLGLMRRYDDGLFISLNRMPFFLMSGMGQMYGRMQIMEARIKDLELQLNRRG